MINTITKPDVPEKALDILYNAYWTSKLYDETFGEDSNEALESYSKYRAIEHAFAELYDVDSYDLYSYVSDFYRTMHE